MTYDTEELNYWPSAELVDLILLYSKYIQDYPDEHPDGGYPVSFLEWYQNDYQEEKEKTINEIKRSN